MIRSIRRSEKKESTRVRVVFGTMTWGPQAQTPKDVGAKQLEALVKCKAAYVTKGVETGKVLIDTARIYQSGDSEEQIGKLLKENPEWVPLVSLHTKANPFVSKLNREGVIKQCNDSLKALGVKCIDIYYIHSPDISVDYEETFGALNELHKEGKFKELGLSAFAAWDVVRVYHLCKDKGWVLPTVYQGVYSAIIRHPEAELLPALRTYGMRFYCYNPLAGGLLTGRYKSVKDAESLTTGRFSPEFDFVRKDGPKNAIGAGHLRYRANYFKEQLFKALDIISEACAAEKIGMAEAAIRWLLHHSVLKGNQLDGILYGASKLDQMTENLNSYQGGPLPDSIVKAYDEAWKVAKPEAEQYFRGYGPGMGTSEWYLAKLQQSKTD